MKLGRLEDLIDNQKSLVVNEVLFLVFAEPNNTAKVSELNRGQLFAGENANGQKLENIGGSYAASTIAYKTRKRQPTDRVTLKDSGDFYRSMQAIPEIDYLQIAANTVKESGDLVDRWGEDIIGLSKGSISELGQHIKPDLIIIVKNTLLK